MSLLPSVAGSLPKLEAKAEDSAAQAPTVTHHTQSEPLSIYLFQRKASLKAHSLHLATIIAAKSSATTRTLHYAVQEFPHASRASYGVPRVRH